MKREGLLGLILAGLLLSILMVIAVVTQHQQQKEIQSIAQQSTNSVLTDTDTDAEAATQSNENLDIAEDNEVKVVISVLPENSRPALKEAYIGLLTPVAYGINTQVATIIDNMGTPDSYGNFIGGGYLVYGDTAFLTDTPISNLDEKQGVVKRISYSGTQSVYGITIGMNVDEVIATLGEPDQVYDYKKGDLIGELDDTYSLITYFAGDYMVVIAREQVDSPIAYIRIEPNQEASVPQGSLQSDVTYRLPNGLVEGDYNETLGNLGGKLFLKGDTMDAAAMPASESVAPGWNGYGGIERYYQLNPTFEKDQLTGIGLPWNHSSFVMEPETLKDCDAPALIVKVNHDLYTAAEEPAGNQTTSDFWYVFFAMKDKFVSYAIYLNADLYTKEEAIVMAKSVKFMDGAFDYQPQGQ